MPIPPRGLFPEPTPPVDPNAPATPTQPSPTDSFAFDPLAYFQRKPASPPPVYEEGMAPPQPENPFSRQAQLEWIASLSEDERAKMSSRFVGRKPVRALTQLPPWLRNLFNGTPGVGQPVAPPAANVPHGLSGYPLLSQLAQASLPKDASERFYSLPVERPVSLDRLPGPSALDTPVSQASDPLIGTEFANGGVSGSAGGGGGTAGSPAASVPAPAPPISLTRLSRRS